ncbi:membrane protein [Treponema sp. R8-4-B8]
MLGPIVNAAAVVVFALVGTFLVKRIPERIEEIIKKAIGLSIIFLGIKGAFENERLLLLIMSMVFGGIIGELIDIDKWMNKFGKWAESKLIKNSQADAKHDFAKGFVSATILFCTGSMSIIGSMQSGLTGNHQILFTKSVMDGSMSIVFGATFGIGTAFSAIPLLLYQGGIALAATFIRDFLNPEVIREMSAVGSLIITAIGFNFLSVKEIKVANLIPAMFIPWVYLTVVQYFLH